MEKWYIINNKSQSQIQSEIVQLLAETKVGDLLQPNHWSIIEIDFIDQDYCQVNGRFKIDNESCLAALKTWTNGLIDFVQNLDLESKITIDWYYNQWWKGYSRLKFQHKRWTHLGNYLFNVVLNFDANEQIIWQTILINNYFNYFVNQCDQLLVSKKLNLWSNHYRVNFEMKMINRSDQDWVQHLGLCWDFKQPVVALEQIDNENVKFIKSFDDCNDSLGCQIIGLIKWLEKDQK